MAFEPGPVLVRQRIRVDDVDVFAVKLGFQVMPAALLIGHQAVGGGADGDHLLLRGEAVFREGRHVGVELALHPGDANHIELVEVGRGYGQETDPLEQRMRLIAGFLEHPVVERQPGQFAIQKPLARSRRRGIVISLG